MNAIARIPDLQAGAAGFRDALRHLTGGVSVITAGTGADATGLTVTTAHSLSIEPAVMIISVNRKSSGYYAISRHRHFCVNVLADGQLEVAQNFSGVGGIKGGDRYKGQSWSTLYSGALALDGALANIDCEVTDLIDKYSHGLFLGEVRAVRVADARQPQLVYQHGSYGSYATA